jgi:uncharacterized protein YndB with AHSA1/START domain
MDSYGVATRDGSVRFERMLPGPIERVWAYLTEDAKRRTWFAQGPMEPRKGGALHLVFDHSRVTDETPPEKWRFPDGPPSMDATVTAWEPPHRLGYTWGESEVAFELEPVGDRVKLVLTHVRLDRAGQVDVSGGWHAHLNMLEDVLEGRPKGPFYPLIAQVEAEYEKRTPR